MSRERLGREVYWESGLGEAYWERGRELYLKSELRELLLRGKVGAGGRRAGKSVDREV